MRSLFACLFFSLSLLLLPGTWAFCGNTPTPPPLKLLHSPAQTHVTSQNEDIHDIKGPVPLQDPKRFLLPVAVGAAVVIIAVLLFWYLRKRRKPRSQVLSPDSVALSELDQAKALMTPEQSLAYAQRISNILRQYIEARFQIHSTRQTTREFFTRLKEGTTIAEIDIKNHAREIQECMEQCDFAKFAHGTPHYDDMILMESAVRTFIESTRQNPEPGIDCPPPPLK